MFIGILPYFGSWKLVTTCCPDVMANPCPRTNSYFFWFGHVSFSGNCFIVEIQKSESSPPWILFNSTIYYLEDPPDSKFSLYYSSYFEGLIPSTHLSADLFQKSGKQQPKCYLYAFISTTLNPCCCFWSFVLFYSLNGTVLYGSSISLGQTAASSQLCDWLPHSISRCFSS